MIPAAFDYAKASSVDEALDLLAADGSRALAGGHSILPLLKLRLAHADRLVDIGGLAELKGVAAHDGGLRIGALTTYRELLDSALVSQGYPLLAEATDRIADLQVRNRGTVGGGVAHADPASDMAGILLALDAAFVLRSRGGTRTVASRDFFRGAFTTALAPGELLTEIVLPPLPAGADISQLRPFLLGGKLLARLQVCLAEHDNNLVDSRTLLKSIDYPCQHRFIPQRNKELV